VGSSRADLSQIEISRDKVGLSPVHS
jgi:hypothetical protein